MTDMQHIRRILVLNPNSSVAVTEAMRRGCRELTLPDTQEVVFATLDGGPAGIESQRDVEMVVLPTCDYFHQHPAAGYVIGCFSDPALALAREELSAPVVGIAESSFLAAMAVGERFGIIAIKDGSIMRHHRAVRAMGVFDRMGGDRALGLDVAGLLDEERSVDRILEVGRLLCREDGADALILGCATMGVYRDRVEAALGVPVIDPTQAAISRLSRHLSHAVGSAP